MEKTSMQKGLKVVSIITIVLAAIDIIGSLMMVAGGGIVAIAGSEEEMVEAAAAGLIIFAAGAIILLGGVVDLIVGILGLRGANDPAKVGPFYVLAIIGLVLAVIGLLCSIFGGASISSLVSELCQVAIMAVCVYYANGVKKQQQ